MTVAHDDNVPLLFTSSPHFDFISLPESRLWIWTEGGWRPHRLPPPRFIVDLHDEQVSIWWRLSSIASRPASGGAQPPWWAGWHQMARVVGTMAWWVGISPMGRPRVAASVDSPFRHHQDPPPAPSPLVATTSPTISELKSGGRLDALHSHTYAKLGGERIQIEGCLHTLPFFVLSYDLLERL
jgi:hypothetical protein